LQCRRILFFVIIPRMVRAVKAFFHGTLPPWHTRNFVLTFLYAHV
jgi:hypothetical protein